MDIIVAVDADWGIGKDGDLLQRISADMKYFREKTTGNVLVMGRKTLESFPNKKPLPNRVNIVLTKNKDYQAEGVVLCHDLAELPAVLENYAGKQVFVAGGGTAFVNAIPAVEKLVAKLSGDEKTGANIIAAALRAPICQIAANAGVEGAVILDKVSKSKSVNYGYDAAHDTFGDMIENGIVDPTKVCRSALENAASVSSMVLTTESLVADLPEKAAPAAPAAPDMGGMY